MDCKPSGRQSPKPKTSEDTDCDRECDDPIPTVIVKSDSDEDVECKCIIEELLSAPFQKKEYTDQFSIVTNGRPTPLMPDLVTRTRNSVRRLKVHNYEMCSWLCGCKRLLKLYCWPCLLFSNETNKWTRTGVTDLNNLYNLEKRHELTEEHISSLIALSRFKGGPNDTLQVNVGKYNSLVKKNKHVVSRLIDVTCVLADIQEPFQSDCEELRKCNFTSMVDFIRRYDYNLDGHISNSTAFSKLSAELQNNLIDSVHQVLLEEIKNQVLKTNYVAIMFEEIMDVGDKCQIGTIIRFTDMMGEVYERFVGFTEFSRDPLLIQHFLNVIRDFDCGMQLIAVAYNGPTFSTPRNSSFLHQVKTVNPVTLSVHWHSHQIFSNLKNMVYHINDCRQFFWTLSGLSSFFTNSSQRTFALHQEIKKRFPALNSTRWGFNTKFLTSVFNYRIDIIHLFQSMIKNADKWDSETYNGAVGFLTALTDFKFNFLLNLFNDIFSQAESFFEPIQEQHFEAAYYMKGIFELKKHLDNIKNDYDDFWLQLEGSNYTVDSINVYKRIKMEECKKETYCKLYCDVIDTLRSRLGERRFSDTENLQFLILMDPKRFPDFSKNYPVSSFVNLKDSKYNSLFDLLRLKTELSVVHKNKIFWKNDIYDLHRFLCSNNFKEILPEVCRLAQLIVTLPITTASLERSFSASKRIMLHLDNKAHNHIDNSPSSLHLLCVEKYLLSSLKDKPDFHEKVINQFAQKTRHIELTYKH